MRQRSAGNRSTSSIGFQRPKAVSNVSYLSTALDVSGRAHLNEKYGLAGEDRMDRFTAVFEQDVNWWVGYVEELPGANAQGRTLDEVRENLKEAVLLVIQANRELARREAEGREVVREELVITG